MPLIFRKSLEMFIYAITCNALVKDLQQILLLSLGCYALWWLCWRGVRFVDHSQWQSVICIWKYV